MDCSKKIEGIRIDELVDHRHGPVIVRCALKTGTTVGFGQVVKIGSDGTVEPAATGNAFYGICCENAVQSNEVTHANVLVHGTVKAAKVLVGEASPAEADIQALKTAGIYVLN